MEAGRPEERGHIVFLDLLRGLAPLLVMWAHLAGWWLASRGAQSPLQEAWTKRVATPLHLWQDGGYLGVLIFFLVSGFVISHVSLRESAAEFAVKRCFRILPPFWAALVLTAVLMSTTGKLGLPQILGLMEGEPTFISSATLSNWFVGGPSMLSLSWTLHIELLFYALILLFIPLSRRSPLAGSWAALATAITVYMFMFGKPEFNAFLWQWMYIPFLLVGRAFYVSWARLVTPPQALCYGLCALTAFWLILDSVATGRLFAGGVEAIVSHAIAVLSFCALCYSRVRVGAPVKFFADISYSLYLLHLPLGSFLLDVFTQLAGLPYELALLVTVTLVVFASWLSFRFFERPTQRLGRRVIARLQLGLAPTGSANERGSLGANA